MQDMLRASLFDFGVSEGETTKRLKIAPFNSFPHFPSCLPCTKDGEAGEEGAAG